jgi:hypothetical protein
VVQASRLPCAAETAAPQNFKVILARSLIENLSHFKPCSALTENDTVEQSSLRGEFTQLVSFSAPQVAARFLGQEFFPISLQRGIFRPKPLLEYFRNIGSLLSAP